jgi:acetolactate synthase-1/2/3 large subunit
LPTIVSDPIARLADCLVGAGIDRAFGVSGSGPSYQLIGALKARGVAYVPVSHEAVGPIAAGAYGWLTGRRAAAISIKGPGMANMMAGMCSAYLEGYAPVCIAENYDDSVSIERLHKRIDQHAIAASVVEGTYSLLALDELPMVLANHRYATRPLYIELSKTAATRLRRDEAGPLATGLSSPDAFDERIAGARAPVAIVGSLVRRRRWEALIDALQIPVLTTAQAKGAIDERKSNAAGVYTGVGRALAPETSLLPLADLVVTIGVRNTEILGVAAKSGFLNVDLPHPLSTSHDSLVDETGAQHVLERLAHKPAWGLDIIERQRKLWQDYVRSYAWMPGQVFAALDACEEPHVLILDTGTFCTIGEHAWQARPGRDFLGSSNGRNLGLGVPHTLGAACARPGTPIFSVLGDGGIRYYLAEMRTIAEMKLPVCFILMKDGRYGSIACNVPVQPADPGIVEPIGTSWLDVIRAMGVEGGRADSAASFERLLDGWDRQRPFFVEAAFDPDIYLHVADSIRG